MNVLSSNSAVSSPFSRRAKAQNTNVIGTRKLPSRTSVGTRLGLPVMKVTTTVSSHSTSPDRNIRSHSRRGRPVLNVAIRPLWSVARRGAFLPDQRGGQITPVAARIARPTPTTTTRPAGGAPGGDRHPAPGGADRPPRGPPPP